MKKILFVLSVSILAGCTKDWECCVTSTSTGAVNNVSTACTDFRGTNEEKNEYETQGSQTYNMTFPVDYTISQVTECVPD